jgi:hypothetical protein
MLNLSLAFGLHTANLYTAKQSTLVCSGHNAVPIGLTFAEIKVSRLARKVRKNKLGDRVPTLKKSTKYRVLIEFVSTVRALSH